MGRSYSIDELRKVKGIGRKTIERIIDKFDDSEYVSKYEPDIRVDPDTLVHGDMLEVMNGVPDESVDLILTDLPYGTTMNPWDEIIDYDKLWKQYNRVIKPNGAILLFGSEPFSTKLRMSNFDDYRYDWVWVKERGTGFANSGKQPLRKYENISVFYKTQPYYDSQGEEYDKPITHVLPINKSDSNYITNTNLTEDGERMYKTYTHRTKHNVLKFNRDFGYHTTQKPTDLLEYLIETYTRKGDLVLDSTMGSGSTGVACVNTDRKFIGIEMDPDYFAIAQERVGLNTVDDGDINEEDE